MSELLTHMFNNIYSGVCIILNFLELRKTFIAKNYFIYFKNLIIVLMNIQ